MPKVETSRMKIVQRLKAEGWESIPGGKHDLYRKEGRPLIAVPRHRVLKPGTARSIAKAAGWL